MIEHAYAVVITIIYGVLTINIKRTRVRIRVGANEKSTKKKKLAGRCRICFDYEHFFLT